MTRAMAQVEMQIAVVNHEMNSAAQEERFQDAAGFKSRLEALQLKQRCMQVEHQDKLRASICHHLGESCPYSRDLTHVGS